MNKNPDGGCTPPVIQINNDPGCVLFHKVVFPASIGDDTTNPPSEFIGKYKNVLLVYEANNRSYMFSSDGMYTQLNNGVTDYEEATNLPQINGNTLIGDKTGAELGLQNELTAGANIQIDSDNVISATDTTYGPATDETIGLVKPGDGLSVQTDGTLDITDIEEYAHFFDTVADMKTAPNLVDGSYARTLGYYSANDGGSALYYIDDIESDIAVGDYYAHLVYAPVMQFECFGCKGDGITDNTSNLQKAIKASSDYGVKIIGKNGNTYKTTGTTITLYSNTNIDLNGSIIENSELFFISDPESVATAGYTGIENVTIKNGTLKGHTEFILLHAVDIDVENIKFESCIYGESHIFDLGGCKNITVKNCEFYGNDQDSTENYREAIQLDYATFGSQPYWQNHGYFVNYDGIPTINVIVDNCTFEKKSTDLCYFNGVGDHSLASDSAIENVTISNCTFDGWTRNAIRFVKVKNLHILNNTFIAKPLLWASVYTASAIDIEHSSNSDTVNENIIIDGNKLISEIADNDKLFARVISNNLSKNIVIRNNIYKGQYDFVTASNIDTITLEGNEVIKCSSFLAKGADTTIGNIISTNNHITEFAHLYHASSSDPATSETTILNANNLLKQSSLNYNNSSSITVMGLTSEKTLTNPSKARVEFDTASNALCTINNSIEVRPDRSLPKIKISGHITVKGTGAVVDTIGVSVYDREKSEAFANYKVRYQGQAIENWTTLALPEVIVDNNILRNSTSGSRFSVYVEVWGSGTISVNSRDTILTVESI